MTKKELERKDAFELVAHIASETEELDLDGVLLASDDHYLVCWTTPLDGRREIVGLEIAPKPAGPSVLDLLRKTWLLPRLEVLRESLPSEVAPVSASLLRSIPLREVMAHRDAMASVLAGLPEHPEASGGFTWAITAGAASAGLTKAELPQFENLTDAVLYVRALEAGLSPAKVIADHRTISVRTAQGRVARARALGYLTPAVGKQAAGELTDKAVDLKDRIEKFNSIRENKRGKGNG